MRIAPIGLLTAVFLMAAPTAARWPATPESWVVGTWDASHGSVHLTRGRSLFRPLVDIANLLGYTLYAVDLDHLPATGIDADLARAEPPSAGPQARPAGRPRRRHRTC